MQFSFIIILSLLTSKSNNLPFQIFLNPLHDLLGDDYGRDPIPARILRACKSTAERSFLHSLGALLAIKEWKEDFKQFCFVSQEHGKKNVHLKNAMHEKFYDKELGEQSVEKEEAMPKEGTLEKLADDSKEDTESLSEEDNSSGMCSVCSTKQKMKFTLLCAILNPPWGLFILIDDWYSAFY